MHVAILIGAALVAASPAATGAGSASSIDDATRSAPAAGGSAPAAPTARDYVVAADAAYDRRDEPGALDEVRAKLEVAERLAPDDYDVLWRQARLYFWLADDPALEGAQKSKLGKRSWEYGDRAVRANPDRVEGWNFAAAGLGNYALGIGILRALGEGIEGKLKERLSRAERIDPDYQRGGIQTAWGRFWFKLPWPKYDAKKSEAALRAALTKGPNNVRARVYLADLYRKEGRKREADEELARATAKPPGQYDAPEERRWQQVARQMLGAP